MNSIPNIENKVFDFLNSNNKIPGIDINEQLDYLYLDNRHIDSMGIVKMIIYFEEEFGIRFEPQDLQSMLFRSVGGLIQLINQLIERKKNA